jgi:hypothetical protein
MKSFDKDSVKQRLIISARKNANWAIISEDAMIDSVFTSVADSEDELARYGEYLLGERKWDTAQNLSSLVTQASLVGHKPHRKISAVGTIVVSHSQNLNQFGRTFFDLDDITNPLGNWTSQNQYAILEGTRFSSINGVEYIAISTEQSQQYTTGAEIQADGSISFEHYKYLRVPVIQGKIKVLSIANVQGTPSEIITLNTGSCEEAFKYFFCFFAGFC